MRRALVAAQAVALGMIAMSAGPAAHSKSGYVPDGSAPSRSGAAVGQQDKPVTDVPRPFEVTAENLHFQHHRLRSGTPARAQLLPGPLEQMSTDLRSFLVPSPTHPEYAGGVVLASRHGVVPVHDAAGKALRYADADTELPADQQVPVRPDTMFDLASVTKTFTTIAVLQQAEAGRIDLDAPVATYLPAFAQNGKGDVTITNLLTHTAGLPAWLPLYSDYPTPEQRLAAVLAVEPIAAPGEAYLYSDLSLITLGMVIEKVTGQALDTVIAGGITGPLGMTDTMFNPPARLKDRIAATEAEPWAGRPMIRGEVHDENAWSLGGVAGHAGLFSTAHDLAILARTLLNGGRYGHARILRADTVREMLVNRNAQFPGDSHGLGFELDQRWYMDGLSTPVTFGHTGFTGTSLVVDPMSDSFVILLTNRVHPTRDWGSNNPARRAVARDLARALAVHPIEGDEAWFSGVGDARTVTLSMPAASGGALSFGLWYDTEGGSDILSLEASADGGATWSPVPFSMRAGPVETRTDGTISGFGGRRWHRATAALPTAGPSGNGVLVRWRYASDSLYQGRGVYVDDVRVDREPVADSAFASTGWQLSPN
ncbi:CubicO group peptidase, beta-lactamase class C family [Nocardioides terrae]|uniref:CubicO group peptidase, beta-lactamase class C family n=1 Tax=Nocardioides terrae TaxID=574651 RepID=A0A1I1KFI5_9ACTN|nr:serine hydrolase domain-containing protein [Nocardioides terrae]SFC56220.1 CubicO group peptidase, beta-lactamase class C family [Nocardioides terrae]